MKSLLWSGSMNVFIGLAAALITLALSSPSLSESLIADAVYLNGKIVTANDSFDIVEALAIREGRIIALGPNAEVRELAGKSTRIVDLKGDTVLPGFYDNHIHLGEAVQEWRGGLVPAASEWLREAHSLEELLESVRRRAATTPKGQWIRGTIIREEWFNQRVPTRWDLDKVAPDHPVALVRGPHTLIANSLALEKAGINEKTPDPEGGWIFKDDQGVPNGRVLEAARRLVAKAMPTEARKESDDDILQRYRVHLGKLAALGITSACGLAMMRSTIWSWRSRVPSLKSIHWACGPGLAMIV
jgi:predicted amidohydrolase YtcJ